MAEIRRLPDLWGMFGFVSSSFLAVTRIIKLQALNSSSIFWREQKLLLFQIAELRTRWSREMWSSAGSAATASSTRSGPAEVWPPLPLISSIPMWLVSSDCLCFTCGWLDFFSTFWLVYVYNAIHPIQLLITGLCYCYVFLSIVWTCTICFWR
jgi:hypothetical protein